MRLPALQWFQKEKTYCAAFAGSLIRIANDNSEPRLKKGRVQKQKH